MKQQQPQADKSRDIPVRRNRLIAAGIMLLPLAVVITATTLWWAVQRGYIDVVSALGTHNHGQLIQPMQDFNQLSLLRTDGTEYRYVDQSRKWTLVIVGDAHCPDSCRQTLWLTRQVHTALGRRALYLRRLYVSAEWPLDSELAHYLAEQHPKLSVLQASEEQLQVLEELPARQGAEAAFYLVDKGGNLMMFYTSENSGKDVIADLKFLMKQVGDD
jgi:cytochrome oxidase Cu insertion factor (SCO1/SenC/PrrC family)